MYSGMHIRSGVQLSLAYEHCVVYVVATDFIANYIVAKRTPLITRLLTPINYTVNGL